MSDLTSDVSVEETSDLGLNISVSSPGMGEACSQKGGGKWPRHDVRFEIGRLQTSNFTKPLKIKEFIRSAAAAGRLFPPPARHLQHRRKLPFGRPAAAAVQFFEQKLWDVSRKNK